MAQAHQHSRFPGSVCAAPGFSAVPSWTCMCWKRSQPTFPVSALTQSLLLQTRCFLWLLRFYEPDTNLLWPLPVPPLPRGTKTKSFPFGEDPHLLRESPFERWEDGKWWEPVWNDIHTIISEARELIDQACVFGIRGTGPSSRSHPRGEWGGQPASWSVL